MVSRRALAIVAAVATLSAACAQLLGIEPIHDDPADGGALDAPADRLEPADRAAPDAPTDDGGTLTDRNVPPTPDSAVIDPALLGCGSPDGAALEFFPSVASPSGLARDDKNIYVADNAGIRRCPVEGCTAGPVSLTSTIPRDFAVNGKHVFYTNFAHLSVVDLNGAQVGGVLSSGARAIAVAGSDVYWDQVGILRHFVDGQDAAATMTYNDTPSSPVVLASNGTYLYFIDYSDDASTGRLVACKTPDCPGGPKTYAPVQKMADPGIAPSLVADDHGVYWTDPVAAVISACDATGCESGVRTIASHVIAASLFLDRAILYWSAIDPNSDVNGSIVRRPLDGGPAQVLRAPVARVDRVVANASCIYWTETPFPSVTTGRAMAAQQSP